MGVVHWKTVTIKVPPETLDELLEYQVELGLESLSAAVRMAILSGLRKDPNTGAMDAIRMNVQAHTLRFVDTLVDELKERLGEAISSAEEGK